MWIKRALFENLIAARASADARAHVLAQRVTAQDTTLDWLKVRLTQLEYERAQLIHRYMGITMPVPEIVAAETTEERLTAEKVLAATIDFNDIGDEAARAQGLDWDAEGRLLQHGKLIQ